MKEVERREERRKKEEERLGGIGEKEARMEKMKVGKGKR